MKKAIAGFFLFVGLLGLSLIHKTTQANMASQSERSQLAAQTRPRDLDTLKRLPVRNACTAHSDWTMETCQTMDQREVSIGMTADQVRLSWGKPKKTNMTVTARREREQWVYDSQYLYVENGVLRSIQSSSVRAPGPVK